MKIPKTFKIGALHWKVVFVPANELQKDCGEMDRSRQTIRINKDLTQEMKEATFLHELIHICEVEMDHSHVETLSILLHQVLSEKKGEGK